MDIFDQRLIISRLNLTIVLSSLDRRGIFGLPFDFGSEAWAEFLTRVEDNGDWSAKEILDCSDTVIDEGYNGIY